MATYETYETEEDYDTMAEPNVNEATPTVTLKISFPCFCFQLVFFGIKFVCIQASETIAPEMKIESKSGNKKVHFVE